MATYLFPSLSLINPMSESVTTALLNYGLLGPVLIACALYVLRLHKELRESQEARVKDAQAVIDRILGVAERYSDVSAEIAKSLALHTEALENLRDEVRSRK